MTGKVYRPGPVPLSLVMRNVARSWGIPPWSLSSSADPSDDDRRRWLVREMFFRRVGM